MNYPTITHGSEDSLDIDIYVLVPHPMEKKDAKPICDSIKSENANLIHIKDNQVVWTYKGTPDECNNSIIHTFDLHPQTIEKPILQLAERKHGLKAIRTLRGLISMLSRTEHRDPIKNALKTPDLNVKIDSLKNVRLETIADFGKNKNNIEVFKFYAFQLAQTISLIKDNYEIFTKKVAAEKFSELKPFLYRVPNSDPTILNNTMNQFLTLISEKMVQIPSSTHCVFNYADGRKEDVDLQSETSTLSPKTTKAKP